MILYSLTRGGNNTSMNQAVEKVEIPLKDIETIIMEIRISMIIVSFAIHLNSSFDFLMSKNLMSV